MFPGPQFSSILHFPLTTKPQVNGYFRLSSNRRDIWWGAGDDNNMTLWNRHLLTNIVPRAYAQLLLFAKEEKVSGEQLAALFPSSGHSEPWNIALEQVCTSPTIDNITAIL